MVTFCFSQMGLMTSTQAESFAKSGITDIVVIPFHQYKYSPDEIENKWNIKHIATTGEQNCIDNIKGIINLFQSKNPNLRFWIGTPGIDSKCVDRISTNRTTAGNTTFQLFKRVMDAVMATHKQYIAGIYYNQEGVYGSYNKDTKVDSFPYSNLYSNMQVWLMNEIAAYVRNTLGKLTLWIPMYGIDNIYLPLASQIKRNAYLVDKTNCFDGAILQASYVTNDEGSDNFPGIKTSMAAQRVCDRSGNKIITDTRYGSCTIGAEYEYAGNDTRWRKYTENYNAYVGQQPMVCYWEGNVDIAIQKLKDIYRS